jgi:hypothetical protein
VLNADLHPHGCLQGQQLLAAIKTAVEAKIKMLHVRKVGIALIVVWVINIVQALSCMLWLVLQCCGRCVCQQLLVVSPHHLCAIEYHAGPCSCR